MPLSATPSRPCPRGLISGRGLEAGRKPPPERAADGIERDHQDRGRARPRARACQPGPSAVPLPPDRIRRAPQRQVHIPPAAKRGRRGERASKRLCSRSAYQRRTPSSARLLSLQNCFSRVRTAACSSRAEQVSIPSQFAPTLLTTVSKRSRQLLRSPLNRGLLSPPEPPSSRFAKASSPKACPSASAHAGCNTLGRERGSGHQASP